MRPASVTILLLLLLLTTTRSPAQVDTGTALRLMPSLSDSINGEEFVMTKSPTMALIWGIIPGGGQVYVENYWKAPIFAGAIGTLVGFSIYNEIKRADYDEIVKSSTPGSNEYETALINRESFRDNRDILFLITGGVYALSLIDAYVGAHLYDFDVGDSLATIRILPDPFRRGVSVAVTF